MHLMEKVTAIADSVRLAKEEWVAANPDNPDLQIQVYFWRGDELVAVASCPLDRDTGLNAGGVGVVGFNADTLLMVFEGYHTSLENSPMTGERWRPREMQYVHESDPSAEEKGWVAPALTLSAHERSGGYLLRLMPYHLKHDTVEWDEVADTYVSSDQEVEADGSMFAYLQKVMTGPTITDHMAQDDAISALGSFLGPEQTLIHCDMACVRALKEKGLITSVVFPVIEGSTRAVQIAERLGTDAVQFVERLSPRSEKEKKNDHLGASSENSSEGPGQGGLDQDQ